MLAPTFGFSVVPWTSAIAAILLGVATGNAWGGRRSRDGDPRSLRRLLLISSASILLPLLRSDLPDRLLNFLGMFGGSLAASVVLFLPASFLLGATGPMLVRLGTSELAAVGRRSGSLNGANALGAIFGTIATGFVLVPTFPLSRILIVTGMMLAGAGVSMRRRPITPTLEDVGASEAVRQAGAQTATG